jgi:chemotaxis protein methyltransferase CheR
MTLQELGEIPEARQSLQRAIYLQPEMVAAHFALGNLARAEEKPSEAARHFGNALRFLSTYEPDAILPEAGGLTAGRLNEIITSLSVLEATR